MQPLVFFVYLFEELHNGFGSLLSSPSTTAFDHETQGFLENQRNIPKTCLHGGRAQVM